MAVGDEAFVTHVTVQEKIYGTGPSELCYVTVERLVKRIVEVGRGKQYIKTVDTFNPEITADNQGSRTVEIKQIKENHKKADSLFVEIPVVTEYIEETGSGPTFQRTKHVYDNSIDNEGRITHNKKVLGSDNGKNGGGAAGGTSSKKESGNSRVEVEVIDRYTADQGIGFQFQKFVFKVFDQGDEEYDETTADPDFGDIRDRNGGEETEGQ